MNQIHVITNIPIRRGPRKAGLKRNVPGTNPLFKPKVFFQSPLIKRPTLSSQKLQIPSSQRVITPTSVERKLILKLLNHRPRAQSMSDHILEK